MGDPVAQRAGERRVGGRGGTELTREHVEIESVGSSQLGQCTPPDRNTTGQVERVGDGRSQIEEDAVVGQRKIRWTSSRVNDAPWK